jgi:hypothetical protein
MKSSCRDDLPIKNLPKQSEGGRPEMEYSQKLIAGKSNVAVACLSRHGLLINARYKEHPRPVGDPLQGPFRESRSRPATFPPLHRVLAKVANWTLQKRQKTVTELKPHPADVIPIKRNARRKGDHLAQIGKIGLLP